MNRVVFAGMSGISVKFESSQLPELLGANFALQLARIDVEADVVNEAWLLGIVGIAAENCGTLKVHRRRMFLQHVERLELFGASIAL